MCFSQNFPLAITPVFNPDQPHVADADAEVDEADELVMTVALEGAGGKAVLCR